MEREVPKDILDRCKAWQFYLSFWHAVHYALGILTILASLTVAYLAFAFQSQVLVAGLSLFAAVCTAVNYFLMPYRKARSYSGAWRLMTSAIIKFKTDDNVSISMLHQAIDDGEALIAKDIQ